MGAGELKWPGLETDHSPPPTSAVKNEWSCISSPPILLYVGHRDNLTPVFTQEAQLRNKLHTIYF